MSLFGCTALHRRMVGVEVRVVADLEGCWRECCDELFIYSMLVSAYCKALHGLGTDLVAHRILDRSRG
jgi:hypothetical protein